MGAGGRRTIVAPWVRGGRRSDRTAIVPAYLAAIEAYLRLGQPELALQVARSGLTALPDSVELRNRVQRLEKK